MATTKTVKQSKKTSEPVIHEKETSISIGVQVATDKGIELFPIPTTDIVHVSMSDILSLDKTSIKDGKSATRSVDRENMESLVLGNLEKIPPISLQATSEGAVCFDGIHRYNAMYQRYRLAFHKFNPDTDPEIGPIEFLNNLPGTAGLEESQFIAKQTIPARFYSFKSVKELLEAAFAANDEHGLRAGKQSRVLHAIWLMQENPGMSMRTAATLARTNKTNIQHFRDAKKRRLPDEELTYKELMDRAKKTATSAGTSFSKACKSVYSALNEGDVPMEKATGYLHDFFKDEDYDMLDVLSGIIKKLSEELKASYADNDTDDDDDATGDYEDFENEDED